jgi:hypothetical protein
LRVKKDGKSCVLFRRGTNNTRVWIDGATPLYEAANSSATRPAGGAAEINLWAFKGIEVAQSVSVVYGMELGRRYDRDQI